MSYGGMVEVVKAEAARLGFLACGITTVDPIPHGEVLDRWLRQGYAGNMRYLHRQARKRKNPALIEPRAKSIVVVLDNYYQKSRGGERPRVARYARGADYHRVIARRLEQLAGHLKDQGAALARISVDAGPVPERELAQRAGLGWIGKNTMLIRPGAGSFFFIGSILTDLPLPPDPAFDEDRCGSCTRCLEACPTGALIEPRLLDARRCISYLTIEYKGAIPDELADRFQGWAFGCDICNEVCPWNVSFADLLPEPHAELAPRRDLDQAGPDFFDRMTPEEFDRRFGDTALERAGLERMRRNWRLASATDRLTDGLTD
jgi:epoxyqueuosine reductase